MSENGQVSETSLVVTAVIPVHNHKDWVVQAIDSVASQNYRPLRIVVVDDGSTDGSTRAVVERLYRPVGPERQGEPWVARGKLPNWDVEVMVHRFTRAHGPAFARNWGMKVGWEGTDAFAFLDSDDMYYPGKIARSVAKFVDGRGHVAAVYSDYDTLRPDGLRVRQYKEPFDRFRLMRECIVNCDSLVLRDAIEQVGMFDEQLRVCEDYDLWLRLSERFMIVHLPEPLVAIRVGGHSSTDTVEKGVWDACWRRVQDKARERAMRA